MYFHSLADPFELQTFWIFAIKIRLFIVALCSLASQGLKLAPPRPFNFFHHGPKQKIARGRMIVRIFLFSAPLSKIDACAKSQNQQMTAELHAIYSELSANNFSIQGGGLHFA
jgi:hypothetical protein